MGKEIMHKRMQPLVIYIDMIFIFALLQTLMLRLNWFAKIIRLAIYQSLYKWTNKKSILVFVRNDNLKVNTMLQGFLKTN